MSVFDADDHEKLRQLFDLHLDVGLHHGAQLAVYKDGEQVVDFAGGETGPEGGTEENDQKHVLFSCTKPYAGACLHQLVDQGLVDYDDYVVEHWPGYAPDESVKAETTIRQVLSHQAGIPQSSVDGQPAIWQDWDAITAGMEQAELDFEPGETAAYHALTYGWLVGALVREVTGETIGSYARENVFEPLGMDDTYIGLPEDVEDDVATLVGFEAFDRCRDPDLGLGGMENDEAAARFNQEHVHRAEVPAGCGVGTASDMARFYACLANGGELDGTRLLSEDTVAEITTCQVEVERDGTLGKPRRYGLGLCLAGTVQDKYGTLSPERVFGHGGLGSIIGWGDAEEGLAMSYVTNGIRDEFEHGQRTNAMADAVRAVYGE